MEIKNFFRIVIDSAHVLVSKPYLLIFGTAYWTVLFLLSKFSFAIASKFHSSVLLIAWTVFFWLVWLFLFSFFISGFTGFYYKILSEKKRDFREFFRTGFKFLFSGFVITALIAIVYSAIWAISNYGVLFVGKLLGFNLLAAQLTFFVLFFAGWIGIFLFFIFSNFYLVIYDLKIKQSIARSFRLVKKNYLLFLSCFVLFFIVSFLVNKIENDLVVGFLSYVIFLPLVIVIMTKFVVGEK